MSFPNHLKMPPRFIFPKPKSSSSGFSSVFFFFFTCSPIRCLLVYYLLFFSSLFIIPCCQTRISFFPGRNPCKLPSRIPGGLVWEDKIRDSLRLKTSIKSVYPPPLALLLLTRCLHGPKHPDLMRRTLRVHPKVLCGQRSFAARLLDARYGPRISPGSALPNKPKEASS